MYKNSKYFKEIKNNPPEIIVLEPGEYQLKIDYPLDNPSITQLKVGKNGLSRAGLVEKIVKQYRKIYQEENESTKIPVGRAGQLLNRNATDGKYGIWGHDIGDLILHTANISKNKLITLGVDS